jgi:hypothetical protein
VRTKQQQALSYDAAPLLDDQRPGLPVGFVGPIQLGDRLNESIHHPLYIRITGKTLLLHLHDLSRAHADGMSEWHRQALPPIEQHDGGAHLATQLRQPGL